MKKIINKLFLAFAIAVCISSLGCKKESTSSTVATATGRLYFHLHTNVDTNEVENYGTVYKTSDGRKVSLTKAQLYISNIQLIKEDGSLYSISDTIVLKQLDPEQYFIANVPVGNYKAAKFHVGLDATTNAKPSSVNALLNIPDMWFGSSAQPDGYVFVNLEGNIDTTANATGTEAQMQPFMYKIGTNAHYKEVTMPNHTPIYAVAKDQTTYMHIIIDYNKLFSGIQLGNSMNLMVHTAADNTSAICNTMSNNIPSMFGYEE